MKALKRNKKFYGVVLSILVFIALIVFAVNTVSAWNLCCQDLKDCSGIQCCGYEGGSVEGCFMKCRQTGVPIICPPET